jgi:hypothetical protein
MENHASVVQKKCDAANSLDCAAMLKLWIFLEYLFLARGHVLLTFNLFVHMKLSQSF